jgi:type IV pilus assembly protein PilA
MFLPFYRRAEEERGFTMIELLVVIMIIGILAAVAVPSFLNQSNKSHDAAAKWEARTAQDAAEVLATEHDGSYKTVNLDALELVEPTLNDTTAATLASARPVSGGKGYSVTSRATDGNTFTITRSDDGSVTRTCDATATPTGSGCVAGRW